MSCSLVTFGNRKPVFCSRSLYQEGSSLASWELLSYPPVWKSVLFLGYQRNLLKAFSLLEEVIMPPGKMIETISSTGGESGASSLRWPCFANSRPGSGMASSWHLEMNEALAGTHTTYWVLKPLISLSLFFSTHTQKIVKCIHEGSRNSKMESAIRWMQIADYVHKAFK